MRSLGKHASISCSARNVMPGLRHSLPTDLGSLDPDITHLDLSDCLLGGKLLAGSKFYGFSLAVQWCKTRIVVLQSCHNKHTCIMRAPCVSSCSGDIPEGIGSLSNLTTLILDRNDLTGRREVILTIFIPFGGRSSKHAISIIFWMDLGHGSSGSNYSPTFVPHRL